MDQKVAWTFFCFTKAYEIVSDGWTFRLFVSFTGIYICPSNVFVLISSLTLNDDHPFKGHRRLLLLLLVTYLIWYAIFLWLLSKLDGRAETLKLMWQSQLIICFFTLEKKERISRDRKEFSQSCISCIPSRLFLLSFQLTLCRKKTNKGCKEGWKGGSYGSHWFLCQERGEIHSAKFIFEPKPSPHLCPLHYYSS